VVVAVGVVVGVGGVEVALLGGGGYVSGG
jgi:hypothetical protein